MVRFMAALAALLVLTAQADAAGRNGFYSREAVQLWIEGYRANPEPARLPAAIHTLSDGGAFKDPENSGYYVGFIAGVLGANPTIADRLIAETVPLAPVSQWALVRAIAYSGLPDWKQRMRKFADRLPDRQTLIAQYLAGTMPTLDAIAPEKPPSFVEKVKISFGSKPKAPEMSFAQNPELLDALWGEYFATASYRPIWRIVALLPWSTEKDSVERLTVGGMAKMTLATNAARYPELLALLKEMAPYQPKDSAKVLAEVIHAADTVQSGKIRHDALAAIDELKRKGPGYKRDVALWGQVGQGAIALGCIAAAVASVTAAGLPCVVGGAAASAGLGYWASKQQ